MVSKKLIDGLIIGYGIFYLFPHEIHVKYDPSWLLANNTGLLEQGLPHMAHIVIGVALVVYGFLLLNNAIKSPKFLEKLY